jgi:hypothetical protein
MNLRIVFSQYIPRLVADDNKFWIVRYGDTYCRRKFFQVYQHVEYLPAGRFPWTVDNKRRGPEIGFPTLRDAVKFASTL